MTKCKEKMIPTPGIRMHYHACTREATKDGYCWQHHPDAKKAREEESNKRYQEKLDNNPYSVMRRDRDEWKRRAILMWDCIPGNVLENFLMAYPEAKDWFEEKE